MRADTLYSVEVAPNNVKYYGIEIEMEPGITDFKDGVAKIPMKQLLELMEYASETHEALLSATVHTLPLVNGDVDKTLFVETMTLIENMLEKTRGWDY